MRRVVSIFSIVWLIASCSNSLSPNPSAESNIELTPPASPHLFLAGDSLSYQNRFYTPDRTPMWLWESTDPQKGIGEYRYEINGLGWVEVGDATTYTRPFDQTLADGVYRFRVAERDATGNWSAPAEQTVVVGAPTGFVAIVVTDLSEPEIVFFGASTMLNKLTADSMTIALDIRADVAPIGWLLDGVDDAGSAGFYLIDETTAVIESSQIGSLGTHRLVVLFADLRFADSESVAIYSVEFPFDVVEELP